MVHWPQLSDPVREGSTVFCMGLLFIAAAEWLCYAQNKGLCLLAQGVAHQATFTKEPLCLHPKPQLKRERGGGHKLVCLKELITNI